MANLYIIAGCNGAGKTTASYAILPSILNCREFVNADNIAAGLSPFNADSVAFEAGRIMLSRIRELLREKADFALETTLATRSYVSLIRDARASGYKITLLYFWLSSPAIAIKRVAIRVSKGGHDIPADVIKRRYYRGISNLHDRYMSICDEWVLVNNMNILPEIIARYDGFENTIFNSDLWDIIIKQKNHDNT